MASNLKLSTGARGAMVGSTGLNAYIGASAILKIYDGTQATDANTAVGAQNNLATFTCNAGGFGTVSGAVLTASAIGSTTGNAAAGTGISGTWFRLFKSDGTTVVMDGTVGVSGCDLNLNNANIANGQSVSISSFTYTRSNS